MRWAGIWALIAIVVVLSAPYSPKAVSTVQELGRPYENLAKFDDNLQSLIRMAEEDLSIASENVTAICYTGFPDTSKILVEAEAKFDTKINNILEGVRLKAWRISAELGPIEENILRGEEKALERMRKLEAAAGVLPDNLRELNEEVELVSEQKRKFVRESLNQLCSPIWERVELAIKSSGGEVKLHAPGMTVARMKAGRLRELSTISEVVAIYHDMPLRAELDISVPTVGAPTWWGGSPPENGYPHEVLVVDSGIDNQHPALSGRVVANRGFPITDKHLGKDIWGDGSHGTAVAGVIASVDTDYKGVAHGANLINACLNRAPGMYNFSDVVDAVEWALDLPDGPEVINLSSGWENENENVYHISDGNSYPTQYIDFVVNTYDLVWAQSAGNWNPGENEKVQVPADAYNAIVVGAMDDKNTLGRDDDNLADFSRRGPTLDGRVKPDLVAPGKNIYTCTLKWDDHDLVWLKWWIFSGTSFSAPHIAGAAALLRSYYSEPYAIKALLLNTADDLGPGGPDNDYGYGYVNLARAYLRRGDVWVDNIGSQSYQFYKGPWHVSDTATLAWNRQITTPPPSPAPVGEVGLFLYDEETGAEVDRSTEWNNVLQVGNSSDFSAVLRVESGDLQGFLGDRLDYALATEENFSRSNPPVLRVSIDAPSWVKVGDNFTINAHVFNDGGITAHNVQATLYLPAGLTLISGSNPQDLGSISEGSSSVASWDAKAESQESYTIGVSADSSCYKEDFTGSVTSRIDVLPYGVDVSVSPSPQSGLHGEMLNYTVTVTNTGIVEDTYDLTVSDSAGWDLSVSPTSLTLGAGALDNATLSVTIPGGAEGGTEDSITVTTTSRSDNRASDSASCVARVTVIIYPSADISTNIYLRTQLKFDIGRIPVDAYISSAKLWLYRCGVFGDWDGGITVNRVDDQNWDEDINADQFNDQLLTHQQNHEGRWMSNGWDFLSVLDQLKVDRNAGNAYTSIRLRWTGDDGTQPVTRCSDTTTLEIGSPYENGSNIHLYSREQSDTAFRPYLEIGYDIPKTWISPAYYDGLPGGTLTYNVNVWNRGSEDDNFDLTIENEWETTLSATRIEDVQPMETRTVELEVKIPSGAPVGDSDTIIITAVSEHSGENDNGVCMARAWTNVSAWEDSSTSGSDDPPSHLENSVWGRAATIYVGRYSDGPERGWLKFDLRAFPAGTTVTRANLSLNCYSTWGANLRVYSVDNDDWSEYTINWLNKPSIGSVLDTRAVFEEDKKYSWDVTSFVSSEYAGDKVVSFCLVDIGEIIAPNHSTLLSSKEYEENMPYLEILVTLPAREARAYVDPIFQGGLIGDTLTYTITVMNKGTLGDNYDLTVEETEAWGSSLSDNLLEVPAGENRTTTLNVTIPSGDIGTINDMTITITSRGNSAICDKIRCSAHRSKATFVNKELSANKLRTLYEVWLDLNALLRDDANEFVLKFYTWGGGYQGENVVSSMMPAHLETLWKNPHPQGRVGVEKAELVMTDEEGATISTLSTFVVTKTTLEIRFSEIPLEWALASAADKIKLEIEFSQIPLAWALAPPDPPPGPGGTTIEVVQGDNFLVRHTLEWNEPENGAYTVTIAWDSYDNHENENFTFLGAEAYFDLDNDNLPDSGLDPILAVITLDSAPSPDYPGSTRYALSVSCPADNKDNRNGQFNVDVTLGAYGFGGIPHIATDNHPIPYQFAGIIIIEPSLQMWNRDPITIRVLPKLVLISPKRQSGAPGATLKYAVAITNVRDVADNFDLTVSDNSGWALTLSENRLENVQSGENGAVTLSVTIPDNALDSTDNITVTATSEANPEVKSSDTCAARAIEMKTAIIYPSDDTNAYEKYPNNNYGSSTSIWVSPHDSQKNRGFLKFVLSELPSGAWVTGAKLHLYCWKKEYDNFDAAAYEVAYDNWSENTLTWNNQPSYGGRLYTVGVAGVGWYTWEIRSFIDRELKGGEVASLCIKGAVEPHGGRARFDSKEWDNSGLHPYLEITYTSPSGEWTGEWTEKADTPEVGGYGEAVVGTGSYIYIAKTLYATSTPQFWRYDPTANNWTDMSVAGLPTGTFRSGTALAWDNSDYIYALAGARYSDSNRCLFFRYSISGDNWMQMADTPSPQGAGDAITWSGHDGYIYALMGSSVHGTTFACYNPASDNWETSSSPPAGVEDGASLVWTGGAHLYAMRGEYLETTPLQDFWRYDIVSDNWTTMTPIPENGGVSDGGSLLWVGNWLPAHADYIYALGGGDCWENPGDGFYRYIIFADTWEKLTSIPYPIGYYVGNRLGFADGHIYYWQGTPSEFYGGGRKFHVFEFPA